MSRCTIVPNSLRKKTMNSDNLRLVAAFIRKHEASFSLYRFASKSRVQNFHPSPYPQDEIAYDEATENCGAICCICGWPNVLYNFVHGTRFPFNDQQIAAEFLGLSPRYAYFLFVPNNNPYENTDGRVCDDDTHPWVFAAYSGLYPKYASPYEATAEDAARILEAIADKKIPTW